MSIASAAPPRPKNGATPAPSLADRLFAHSPDLLGIASAIDKTWLSVNPAFQRILGYDPRDLLSRRPIDIVHPDDVARCLEVEAQLYAGKPVSLENRILANNGSYIWISWTLSIDPNQSEVFCVGRDISDHKRRLDAISRLSSEVAELEAIYDGAPVGLALIDSDLRFKRINRRLAEINGAPVVSHIGRSVWDIVPNLRTSAEPALRRVLEHGCTIENYEVVGVTAGTPFSEHRWRAHLYPIEQGGSRYVAVICQDVTEQHRTERELAENEARLRVALEGAKAGAWELAFDCGATFWSPEMYDLLGLPLTATPSVDTFSSCIIDQDRERTLASFNSAARSGSDKFDLEFRIKRPDGRLVWLSAVGCFERDHLGNPTIARGINQDITARKCAELRLAHREAQLREAVIAGQVFTYDWDRKSDLSERSSNASQILGISAEDELPTGHAFLAHVHADDREMVRLATTGPTPENPHYELSYRFVRPDGDVVWIEETGAASFDDEGHVLGVHGICRDITARRRTEAQNSLLVGEISHRAKNMLAVLQAVVRFTKAETVAEFSEAITHRIQALARVQGLLATSGWTSTDLATILESELEPFGGVDGDRISMAGPPVCIRASAIQTLVLVFHELATNAAKYGALSSATGRVNIAWQTTPGAGLEVVWTERGGPPSKGSGRLGFGSRLIRESLQHLGGGAKLNFEPGGLVCTITVGRAGITDV